MGKRRRSDADHLIDAVALFPPWVGVVLAIGSFLVLNHLAQPPLAPEPVVGIEQMGDVVGSTLVRTIASLGRIVFPAIFLLGALLSVFKRRRRASLHARAREEGLSAVAAMSWQDFERLTQEMFHRQGYTVMETRSGPDGGIDLTLRKEGRLTQVQCKHWKNDVGVKVVRELNGVVAARKAQAGIVVSSGGFTDEARRFARSAGLQLMDGKLLEREIGYRGAVPQSLAAKKAPGAAACPLCEGEMVVRTAKRGAAAGSQFLGCKRYPACRGTINL